MSASSDNLDSSQAPIRCGMCGKPNAAEAAVCVHCGARLRPVTSPDEIGLTRPLRAIPPRDEPTDPLADLRAEIEGDIEATVIRREGARAISDLINEMEPDFTLGPTKSPSPMEQEELGQTLSLELENLPIGIPDRKSEVIDAPLPEGEEALPDWVIHSLESDLSSSARGEVELPSRPSGITPSGSKEESAKQSDDELPDWLAESLAAQTKTPKPSAPAGSTHAGDIPDWLTPPSPTKPVPPSVPGWLPYVAESAEPVTEQLPTWLPVGQSGSMAPTAREQSGVDEVTEEVVAQVELPDWLKGAVEATPSRPIEMAKEDVEDILPDWLKAAPPRSSEPKPAEPEPLPDWLREAAEVVSPARRDEAADEEELPDWLREASLSEREDSPAETAAPVLKDVDAELLDLMSALDIREELTKPSVAEGEDDLLGLPSDLALVPASEEEEGPEEEAIPDLSQLPPWLQQAQAVQEREGTAVSQAIEVTPDLLDQISDLSFEAITGRSRPDAEPVPEKVGALKDLVGVIQPEIIFEGQSLRVEEQAEGLILTEQQAKQVDLIEKLLDREAQAEQPVKGQAALPVMRWLISLMLVVIIAIPSLFPVSILPVPKAEGPVQAANQVIDGLPQDAIVLIAFEYEPGTAAEMGTLALALLHDLASHPDATVYAVSTQVVGTEIAQRVLLEANPGERAWLNLGYISGGPSGISALVSGNISGVPSPLAFDYAGSPTGISARSLSNRTLASEEGGMPVDLIIVLAARSEHLRAWIEQAGQPTGIPILAATSVGSAPLVYPYEQSGQLVGVLSGINDAAAYEALQAKTHQTTSRLHNAQALGALVVAITIALGNILLGIRSLREQQELVR